MCILAARLVFTVWVAGTIATVSTHAAPAFMCEGNTKEILLRNGEELVTSEWKFRFVFDDCRWEMAIQTKEENYEKTTEILYDGIDIVSLSPGGGTQGNQRFEHSAGRFSGSVPQFGGHGAFIWLALGSACVLAEKPSEFPPVFSGFEGMASNPIKLILEAVQPALPESIVFYYEGSTAKTNAVYRVLQSTNYLGLVVPTHFETIMIDRDSSPLVRYEGYVVNIATNASARPSLTLPPGTLVQDHRLNADRISGDGFEYITNKWLSREEARSRPEFANGEPASDDRIISWSARILVFVTLFVGLISLVLHTRKTNKTIQNNE